MSVAIAEETGVAERTCGHALRAQARMAEGRHAEALEALRKARRGVPAADTPGWALKEADALFGLTRYREALGVVTRAMSGRPADPDLNARLRIQRGHALWMTGRVAPGRMEVERAARRANAPLTEARVQETLGLFAWKDQDVEAARGHLSSARDIYAGHGSLHGQVRTLEKESGLLRDTGRWPDALRLQGERVEMAARAGRIDAIALARSDRGALLATLGRWSEARREIERAAELFRQVSDPREWTLAGLHRAALALAAGDLAAARAGLERARSADVELKNPRSLAEILILASDLDLAAGDAAGAEAAAAEALGLVGLVGDRAGECRSRVRRAHALLMLGRGPEAIREARRAVHLSPRRPDLEAMAQLALGRALLRTWRQEARLAFERAAAVGYAGSGVVHAARLGAALAGSKEGPAPVRAALQGLEAWGDRRLLSLALAEVRGYLGTISLTSPLPGPKSLPAEAEPAQGSRDAAAVVDAAAALQESGPWRERWAAAMRAIRPVLPWCRAVIVGPESWELRDDLAAPIPPGPDDPARLQPVPSEPALIDLAAHPSLRDHPVRALFDLGHAVVAPLGADSLLWLDRRAGDAPPTARDLGLGRELARLVRMHPPEAEPVGGALPPARFPEIVGRCSAIERLFGQMAQCASSDVPVHVFGETGTGKERVARALHARSPRAKGPFVAVNASSIPDELFEAEMFGHTRGAFTGAVMARDGHVAAAEGGTLFIDEVADLSPRAQAKLLRFLQEREYRRLGESSVKKANVRILSAANVPLKDKVAAGQFRRDLLYRLNVVTLELPPLRERGDDILLLARHFLRAEAEKARFAPPRLPADVAALLTGYAWPGNIRELENEVLRLVALSGGGALRKEHLSPDLLAARASVGSSLKAAVLSFEREYLARALERNGGNRARTAEELGITRQALVEKIRKFGL